MTDKATIQPKSKPEKTTISISGETYERLEIYCRANGILRKEFVSLALEYFERTGFDLKSNALDYSPLEKIIGELNEVKATMQTSNEGTEAIRQLLQAVREQTAKQLPAPELIVQATEAKAKAESLAAERAKDLQLLQEENNRLRNEIKVLQEYKEKAHRELCRIRDEQKTIGKIKVNTKTNHTGKKNCGNVKGGFDRTDFFRKCETSFDKRTGYDRAPEQTFDYLNTMKNGSPKEIFQKKEWAERVNHERLEKMKAEWSRDLQEPHQEQGREENQQQGNSIIFQVLYIDQAPQRKKQQEEELDQPKKRSRGFGMGM